MLVFMTESIEICLSFKDSHSISTTNVEYDKLQILHYLKNKGIESADTVGEELELPVRHDILGKQHSLSYPQLVARYKTYKIFLFSLATLCEMFYFQMYLTLSWRLNYCKPLFLNGLRDPSGIRVYLETT